MRSTLHQIRNNLAVAIGSVEAFRDGVLEPTPQRLERAIEALRHVDVLLDKLVATADAPKDRSR